MILRIPKFLRNSWYYPAWTMSEPWKFGTSKGGDEFNRRTSCLHLGPLGVFVYAHEDDEWYTWMYNLVQKQLATEEKMDTVVAAMSDEREEWWGDGCRFGHHVEGCPHQDAEEE